MPNPLSSLILKRFIGLVQHLEKHAEIVSLHKHMKRTLKVRFPTVEEAEIAKGIGMYQLSFVTTLAYIRP